MELKVLGRSDLKKVLDMRSVVEGVKTVYGLKAKGDTEVWPLVAYEFAKQEAVMDIRSGAVLGSEQLHGLKMLNNFPHNREKGIPVFTGMLMVFDSETGLPLGVMDASYITGMRTGAAGAVGASVLARKDSTVLTVLGAGRQAMVASELFRPQRALPLEGRGRRTQHYAGTPRRRGIDLFPHHREMNGGKK